MGRDIRILVVDDQPVICEGLRALASCEPDLEVVGAAHTLVSARARFRALRPDVVVAEVSLGGAGTLGWMSSLRRAADPPAVVAFSSHDHGDLIHRATRAGVRAYILKSDPSALLMTAVRRAAAGELTFSERLRPRIVIQPGGAVLYTAALSRGAGLTPRQLDVVRGLVDGLTVRQIAVVLKLSEKTVDNHKTRAMARLGVHNRAELARAWYEEQLWTLGSDLRRIARIPAAS